MNTNIFEATSCQFLFSFTAFSWSNPEIIIETYFLGEETQVLLSRFNMNTIKAICLKNK